MQLEMQRMHVRMENLMKLLLSVCSVLLLSKKIERDYYNIKIIHMGYFMGSYNLECEDIQAVDNGQKVVNKPSEVFRVK